MDAFFSAQTAVLRNTHFSLSFQCFVKSSHHPVCPSHLFPEFNLGPMLCMFYLFCSHNLHYTNNKPTNRAKTCSVTTIKRQNNTSKKKVFFSVRPIIERHQVLTSLLDLCLHSLHLLSVSTFVSYDASGKVKVNSQVVVPCTHTVCQQLHIHTHIHKTKNRSNTGSEQMNGCTGEESEFFSSPSFFSARLVKCLSTLPM